MEDCCCSVLVIIIILVVLYKILTTEVFAPPTVPQPPQGPQVIYERETIREIIMIRCQYCGTRYDEHLTNCPKCGGK